MLRNLLDLSPCNESRLTMTQKPKSCEKKLKMAELRLQKILSKIDQFKLNDFHVARLSSHRKQECKNGFVNRRLLFASVVAAVCLGYWIHTEFSSERCIMELPSISKAVFRPPIACDMCTGVDGVAKLANLSAREFEDNFAYGSQPLLVTDATTDWRAMKEFNYNFFKTFYSSPARLGRQINDCFYFAYKSGLNTMQEVFNMPESRANFSGEPWYVGWSTCFEEETRRLRDYYTRPYFLPETAESDMVDWIFMGGPGQGAHMHVDSVRHMSWQAQVRGRKQWELAPPPECYYVCNWFSFTVAPGEILVVDTNRWYHRTKVLPGDISITIGAEYD